MSLMPLFSYYWSHIIRKGDDKRIESQTAPSGVAVTQDLSYIDDGKWQHFLDVYYPEGTDKPLPIIIDIHGGGWMYGTKRINKYYNMTLAKYGYTVFSINYSLIPEVTVDVQLQECMKAIEWISKNAQNYFGDLSEVYLTGDSAGGFLAAFTAMLEASEELRIIYETVHADITFKALALTSPVCYMENDGFVSSYTKCLLGKEYKLSAYHGFVNLDKALEIASLPPTFMITSDGDIPAQKATLRAYNDIKAKGIKCKLVNLHDKKLTHVFSVINPFNSEGVSAIEQMLDFFKNSH